MRNNEKLWFNDYVILLIIGSLVFLIFLFYTTLPALIMRSTFVPWDKMSNRQAKYEKELLRESEEQFFNSINK